MPHTLLTEEELTYAIKFKYKIGADGLYSRYAVVVYKVIFAYVRQTPMADELLQQTFAYAWTHIDEFQQQEFKLNCWLTGIARRLSKYALVQAEMQPAAKPSVDEPSQMQPRIRGEFNSRVAI